ncbi:MAG TPA: pyridoxamine 5'-phosphate oxidase [Candidatus Dormibacteraeota bacterium]|nr:pyridoxamine 5'-phosphate oxidase [Candidatus Dormibacteraeota bacterium]
MDPFQRVTEWYREAQAAGQSQPDAMALATAGADGRPSVRMVLLKSWDSRGFVFFTNRDSRKGSELAANPRAALTVYWGVTGRSVRAAGRVSRTARAESLAYWATRPRESQAAAWASPQSRPIAASTSLEAAQEAVLNRFPDRPIPLPPFWGGYRLRPDWVEFWEHRPDRLHDRLLLTRRRGGWREEVLGP